MHLFKKFPPGAALATGAKAAHNAAVRRSLAVLGAAAAALILSFLALFASGDSGVVSGAGSLPVLTTTTAPTRTTVTTIVTLRGPAPGPKKLTIALVSVPNLVGMTLAQANATLGAVGLGVGETVSASKPSGQSATGTILAQSPVAGSQAQPGEFVQLTISGY
jgi:hypothetical protein